MLINDNNIYRNQWRRYKMPNITTTLYVSDEDYVEKYEPNKQKIVQRMREIMREEMGISKKDKRKKDNTK